ncbi:MAG: cyclic-di-AMP receptor [Aggregatilineaceae bacterium]
MSTKLIIVVVHKNHDELLRRLLDAGFRVTQFSSLGGFLRRRSATLLVGVEEGRLDEALAMIRQTCPTPPRADEHSATLFVLNAGRLVTI